MSLYILLVYYFTEVLMMKQSKRLLAVLLARIMMCSIFTVGAQAMKTAYDKPYGYDSVLDPIVSIQHYGC